MLSVPTTILCAVAIFAADTVAAAGDIKPNSPAKNETGNSTTSATLALSGFFHAIEKRNLSLPDDFTIEFADDGWKIVSRSSRFKVDDDPNDGDVFFVNREDGTVKQLSGSLRVLNGSGIKDDKKTIFLNVFAKTYEDASRPYRDLGLYRISVSLERRQVHVDYFLADPQMLGGGPHYKVDSASYEILERIYSQ